MSYYVIELTSVQFNRTRYLKAHRKEGRERIISTRHEINARKFRRQEDAFVWTQEHGSKFGWMTTVKQVGGEK